MLILWPSDQPQFMDNYLRMLKCCHIVSMRYYHHLAPAHVCVLYMQGRKGVCIQSSIMGGVGVESIMGEVGMEPIMGGVGVDSIVRVVEGSIEEGGHD